MANGVLRHDFSSGNQQMWQFLRDVQDKKALRKLKEQQGLATAAHRERQEKRAEETLDIRRQTLGQTGYYKKLTEERNKRKEVREESKFKQETEKRRLENIAASRKDKTTVVANWIKLKVHQGADPDELEEQVRRGEWLWDNRKGTVIDKNHERFFSGEPISGEVFTNILVAQMNQVDGVLVTAAKAGTDNIAVQAKAAKTIGKILNIKNFQMTIKGKDIGFEVPIQAVANGALERLLAPGTDPRKIGAVKILTKHYKELLKSGNVPKDYLVKVMRRYQVDKDGNLSLSTPQLFDLHDQVSASHFATLFPKQYERDNRKAKLAENPRKAIESRRKAFDNSLIALGKLLSRRVLRYNPGDQGDKLLWFEAKKEAENKGIEVTADEISGILKYSVLPVGDKPEIAAVIEILLSTARQLKGWYENDKWKDHKDDIGNYYERSIDAIKKYEWILDKMEEYNSATDMEGMRLDAERGQTLAVKDPGSFPRGESGGFPKEKPKNLEFERGSLFGGGGNRKDTPTIEEEKRKRRGVFKFRTN